MSVGSVLERIRNLRGSGASKQAAPRVDLTGQELHEAVLLLQDYEASGLGWFWASDREGRITYISDCVAKLLGQERSYSLPLSDYHARQAFVWAMQDEAVARCGVRILDPLPYLCADGSCPSAENGRPIYRDGDHFNESGNRRLVPMFRAVFDAQR